jgi:hypothetical protein
MANDNPLWGAPRIHGELLKLGVDISEATVQRYMPKKPRRTTHQQWKTFLKNHSAEIISLDFFTVPTITFRLLHVLVFLSHDRRKIIHLRKREGNLLRYSCYSWDFICFYFFVLTDSTRPTLSCSLLLKNRLTGNRLAYLFVGHGKKVGKLPCP